MHHVAVAVRDLDAAEAFATRAFGFPVVNRLDTATLRAVFLACGPALVELVEFTDPGVVDSRLGDQAAAIDHIALAVPNLDDAIRALTAHGVETAEPQPIVLPAGHMHFTRPESSAGVRWQLLETPGT
jgi:catechol 2,3-dioxygenase-like lactoylglutathione lyase family enzyme